MADPAQPVSMGLEDETAAATLPRQLGAYLLLQRLGRGGMGTVYLARQTLGEFERLCVVKLVRRRHLGDPLLRQRFLDEARTTLLLTHRNICRVLDVGTAEGLIFIAMEHVNGRDLRSILKRVAQRINEGKPGMPPAIAAAIVGEVLEALDSAHRLVDPSTGKPLEIVHRDVSPHNVMVSFEGEVKLIDFGVARSATQLAQTDPGLVVGKLAYMSPEQAGSSPIDGRSDVFAAGILGYETFAADRFYEKLSVDEIGEMLEEGTYRPSRMTSLPMGIRLLIEKALTHDVLHRPRAGELRKELMTWAVENKQFASAADVRAFLAELFPGEEDADRKRFRELFQRTAQPQHDDDGENETVSEGSIRGSNATVQERRRTRSEGGSASSSVAQRHSVAPTNTAARRNRRAPLIAAGAAAVAIAGVAVGLIVVHPPAPTPQPPLVPLTVVPTPPPPAPHPIASPPPAPARTPPPPTPEPTLAPATTSTSRHRVREAKAEKTAEKTEEKPVEKPVDKPVELKPAEKPALPARPRSLPSKVKYLGEQCAALSCSADAQKRIAGVRSMSADEVDALKADVDKCLDACGAPK